MFFPTFLLSIFNFSLTNVAVSSIRTCDHHCSLLPPFLMPDPLLCCLSTTEAAKVEIKYSLDTVLSNIMVSVIKEFYSPINLDKLAVLSPFGNSKWVYNHGYKEVLQQKSV